MPRLPIDNTSAKISRRARAVFHYSLDSDLWEYRESTGQDIGCDCTIELCENNKWQGFIIHVQIKGSASFAEKQLKDAKTISFPLEKKTINLALSDRNPFILALVDVTEEKVYYLPIQDYFIEQKELFNKDLDGDGTISLHVPMQSSISFDSQNLKELAKKTYVNGPGKSLSAVADALPLDK